MARVVLDELGNLTVVGEGIWIIAAIGEAWELQGPVGKLKMEQIPPFAVPPLRHTLTLKNNVLSPTLPQVVAHGEARLASTDDDRVVVFSHSRVSKVPFPINDQRSSAFAPWWPMCSAPAQK